MRLNGGVIGRANTPSLKKAGGVWSLAEQNLHRSYRRYPKYTEGWDIRKTADVEPKLQSRLTNTTSWGGSGNFDNGMSHDYSSDGVYLYVLNNVQNRIVKYILPAAYDISNAQLTSDWIDLDALLNAGAITYSAIHLSADNSKIYVMCPIGSNSTTIYELNLNISGKLSSATYNGKYINVPYGTGASYNCDFYITPNGSTLFTYIQESGVGLTVVRDYTLSTAWDISTAVATGNFFNDPYNTSSGTGFSIGINFTNNGTYMYINAAQYLLRVTLSVAYSLSGTETFSTTKRKSGSFGNINMGLGDGTVLSTTDASSTLIKKYVFGTVDSPETLPAVTSPNTTDTLDYTVGQILSLTFKPDGTKMYTSVSQTGCYIYEWDLATAGDPSTAVMTNYVTAPAQSGAGFNWIVFNPDGTKFYGLINSTDTLYEYNLSTAWDITTISSSGVLKVFTSQDTSPQGFYFKPDGTKLYMLGATTDDIFEYDLSTAWDLSSISYNSKSYALAQTLTGNSISMSHTGDRLFIGSPSDDYIYQYTLSTPWDITSASYDRVLAGVLTQEGNINTLLFNADGTRLYIAGAVTNGVVSYIIPEPYYLGVTRQFLPVGEATPTGIAWKPDGTKVFIFGSTSDRILAWNVSTPWDISTAINNSEQSANLSTYRPAGVSLEFKPDGSMVFIGDASTGHDNIIGLPLTTAWDVSTVDVSSILTGTVFSSVDTSIQSFKFADEGATIYMVGSNSDRVYKFTLSTPYDVSTMSYTNIFYSVAGQETFPTGVFFKSDGEKMFVIGTTNDKLIQYTLLTPWDITTASFDRTLDLITSASETNSNALTFKPDGRVLYFVGAGKDSIVQMDLR